VDRLTRRLMIVPALLVVGFVRLVSPLFLIRFGIIYAARIGHFAANMEIYLGEKKLGLHPRGKFGGLDIWSYHGTVCNKQLANMVERKVCIWPSTFSKIVYICNRSFIGWEKHVCASTNMDRDVHDTLKKTTQNIQFTPSELKRGRKQMQEWGVLPKHKWVCLIARDAEYLPHFSYHSYRDVDISTYQKTAVMLAERGYHVFRMGAKVKKPLDINHPLIHDYATNGMRSDFMDIYLGAFCSFCISSPCGIDAIATIFR